MNFEFSEEQLAAHYKRLGIPNPHAQDKPEPVKTQKRSKYGNARTERDGILFDSKREADHYSELMIRLRAGEIYGVFRQHPFLLPGGIVYRADFVILNPDGTYTVQDAKGMRTKEYMLKKRLMRECMGIAVGEV